MIMASTSVVSHIAFHSHSCHSCTAIRNLTSLLCNMPQAPKSPSIYTRSLTCVCVCVSLLQNVKRALGFKLFPPCQIVVFAYVHVCTYEHKMLSPGIFLLIILPSSSSSWHSLYFPLKLYLAIYSEEDGRDHQSWFHISKPIRSSPLLSLHHVLLPSSAVLKQEGRENPRRNPAPPAHQRPTGGKKEKNSGGLEEGGKSVGMCERECEK